MSLRTIAAGLHRNPSTISREVRRNRHLGSAGQAERFVGDNSDGGDSGYLCSGKPSV